MTMKVGRSLGKPSRHELSQFSSVCCLKEHNAMFWTFEVVRNIYRYIAVIGASGEAKTYIHILLLSIYNQYCTHFRISITVDQPTKK